MTKKLLTALLVGTALAAVPVRAAEDRTSTAYVVLVGVNEYADKQIKTRPHAEADAQALYDLFTHKDYLGADKDHIRLLLGSKDAKRDSEPATKANILKALNWAVANAGRDDLLVFAFFGQGAPLGNRICLFGSDSNFKDRDKGAVAAAEIEHELEKLKSQRFLALVDVNLKGFEVKESVAEPNVNDFFKVFIGTEGKDEEETPREGRVLFLATDGLRPSLETEANGLFAKMVIDGLKGAGDSEGYEADGLVTVDELSSYLNKELPEQIRKLGKTKEEREILHFILGARTSHFEVTKNPAVTAKASEAQANLAKLAADKKITQAEFEEGEKLLHRMPVLKAQQDLRKAYQKLASGKLTPENFRKERDDVLALTKLKRSEALAYAEKVMQAIELVQEGYVKDLTAGELVSWAVRGLFRRLEEKKLPAEFADRLAKAKNLKDSDLKLLLADVREKLGKREDLDNNKDVDISVQQMLGHLDPYTNYIDAEMKRRFEIDTGGRFYGIGIQIRKDATTDQLLVVTPIKGSPAYKAGLKTGDLITQVICYEGKDGKPLDEPEVILTKGLNLSDAVKRIMGKPGTRVKVTVQREGSKEPIEFEITRGAVEVETVLGVKRKKGDDWDYVIDKDSNIAYVRLTQFAKNTHRDLARVIEDLEKTGIKGFILDLRFNPGGLLDGAVKISDLFIDDGLIVSIRPRVGRELSYSGETKGSHLGFPMVCLINGGSASASEIVSACLQDHHRAKVMGERSYGKATVQNIAPFEATGGMIKMTTATYWRPSGKNINKSSTKGAEEEEWGVMPDKDFHIKLSPKERDDLAEFQRDVEIIGSTKPSKADFKDKQLENALEYLRNQIKTVSRAPDKKAG